MKDSTFLTIMAWLYIIPIPLMWILIPPASAPFVIVYLAINAWGVWGARRHFTEAKEARAVEGR